MEWCDLWLYWKRSTQDIQKSIWDQIDLMNLLMNISIEERRIVLKDAPDYIIAYANERFMEMQTTRAGTRHTQTKMFNASAKPRTLKDIMEMCHD